jgi:NAD+ synthase (glutamine-hydrolysing)
MDFEGNLARILESIRQAKAKGARFRLGPELEVTGYGCEDHFLEEDTFVHAWEVIEEILKTDATNDILCDIGMPVYHASVRYNCRIYLLNKKILLIRPKMYLANDGNYRETRFFAAWSHGLQMQEHYLPRAIQALTGQLKVPIGVACVATRDTCIAAETCEELFTANSPHIFLTLSGAEIIANGSGSHHTLRKRDKRMDLMRNASSKCGGVYMYANQRGCDGARLYFDGTSMIYLNGDLMTVAPQFSLVDVEVVTATVDLTDIRSYRGAIASRNVQASQVEQVHRVDADFFLGSQGDELRSPTQALRGDPGHVCAEEEIGMGPACWLWDYLRRSGLNGFFLPLSGGADSASVCAIVGIMCELVAQEYTNGNAQVIADIDRIMKSKGPHTRQVIAERVLHCVYMGTQFSSEETLGRARLLAQEVGASFHNVTIDGVYQELVKVFEQVSKNKPDIRVRDSIQNIAMQNIQARSRMVLSYLFSQLLLWDRDPTNKWPGQLLVLGCANVDEALRGYYTKYDCSAADINPIGGISKEDLKKFLRWAGGKYYPGLLPVLAAKPTAELQPTDGAPPQEDEVEMGMSYAELSRFGFMRGVLRCGPVSMFSKLVHEWPALPPADIAVKVKRFFKFYAINRHKMTTLTPSYHAENYSPDDNRFDLRQFLYNVNWPWQFKRVDELAKRYPVERKSSL